VPWLALPDIRKLHGKYAYATGEYTNESGLANSSARLLPVGTVCVSRTASIGFVTILGRPMATSQDFCNWVCDKTKLNEDFLMYAFMASQHYLRGLGSGAVHKTIYMPTIESFHVYAPDSVDEQTAIAQTLEARLKAAEDVQAKIRSQLTDAERLAERLLISAFSCE
jgi:type I restriction enzyme, S subunit